MSWSGTLFKKKAVSLSSIIYWILYLEHGRRAFVVYKFRCASIGFESCSVPIGSPLGALEAGMWRKREIQDTKDGHRDGDRQHGTRRGMKEGRSTTSRHTNKQRWIYGLSRREIRHTWVVLLYPSCLSFIYILIKAVTTRRKKWVPNAITTFLQKEKLLGPSCSLTESKRKLYKFIHAQSLYCVSFTTSQNILHTTITTQNKQEVVVCHG